MRKPNIHITAIELKAIKMATDTLSGMAGTFDEDFNAEISFIRKHVDKMLKRNGLKPRNYT